MENVTLWVVTETVGIASLILLLYASLAFYLYVQKMKRVFKDVKTSNDYHWLLGHVTTVSYVKLVFL